MSEKAYAWKREYNRKRMERLSGKQPKFYPYSTDYPRVTEADFKNPAYDAIKAAGAKAKKKRRGSSRG